MKSLLKICFIIIIHYSSSELIRFCPLGDEWSKFRDVILCNRSTFDDEYCPLDYDLFHQLNGTAVVVVHENQWDKVGRVSKLLSFCGIDMVLLKSDILETINLNKFCVKQQATTFILLTKSTYDFINIKGNFSWECDFIKVTRNESFLYYVPLSCTNVKWVLGNDELCSSNHSNYGMRMQKVINDTYWDDEKRKRLMPNKTLKVGSLIVPPFMKKTKINDTYYEYEGIVYELLKTLARNVGFDYEIIETTAYGGNSTGTWNGLVGQVLYKEVDLVAASLTITESRSSVIDFTASFYFEEIGILIKKPETKLASSFWKMFLLFSYQVWIGIGISTVISMAVLFALHKFSAVTLHTPFTHWTHSSWFIFSSMLNQPEDMSPKTWSVQNFLTFFWIYAFVLISMYGGGLIALFTSSKIKVPFTDLDGLASYVKMGKFKVCIEANTAFYAAITAPDTAPSYKIIGDFFTKNKQFVADEDFCIKQVIDSDDIAYLGERTRLKEIQVQNCDDDKKLILLDDSFYPGNFAFAVPKGSPMLSIFSYEIYNDIEAGLLDRWKANYSTRLNCTLAVQNQILTADKAKLSLGELGGPFVTLFIGLFFSIIAYCIEFYKIKHTRRKRCDSSLSTNASLIKNDFSRTSVTSVSSVVCLEEL